MAGLKALVIVMAIAIIVGATVLVTVMVQRAGNLDEAAAPAPMNTAPVNAAPANMAPANMAIELPIGARVVDSRLDGGRILLRVVLNGGAERILIIDARTGARLATFEVTTKGRAR